MLVVVLLLLLWLLKHLHIQILLNISWNFMMLCLWTYSHPDTCCYLGVLPCVLIASPLQLRGDDKKEHWPTTPSPLRLKGTSRAPPSDEVSWQTTSRSHQLPRWSAPAPDDAVPMATIDLELKGGTLGGAWDFQGFPTWNRDLAEANG